MVERSRAVRRSHCRHGLLGGFFSRTADEGIHPGAGPITAPCVGQQRHRPLHLGGRGIDGELQRLAGGTGGLAEEQRLLRKTRRNHLPPVLFHRFLAQHRNFRQIVPAAQLFRVKSGLRIKLAVEGALSIGARHLPAEPVPLVPAHRIGGQVLEPLQAAVMLQIIAFFPPRPQGHGQMTADRRIEIEHVSSESEGIDGRGGQGIKDPCSPPGTGPSAIFPRRAKRNTPPTAA